MDLLALVQPFAEHSPEPFLAASGEQHVVRYVNPAFVRLLGKRLDDIVGRPIRDVLPPVDLETCLPILDRVHRTGAAETFAGRPFDGGSDVPWTYAMWRVADPAGRTAGLVVQVTDTTGSAAFRAQLTEMNEALAISAMRQNTLLEETVKLNAQLKDALEVKSLFLANMSHEVRTPIGVILGFADLLRSPSLSQADRTRFVDTMLRNGRDLLRIIDDILDLSKAEAGRLELEKREVSLPSLLTEVAATLSARARQQGIGFFVESSGVIPPVVVTDATRLRQILFNVVGNAIKFTKVGHVKVTVSTREVAGAPLVAFLVEDTGCGISPENREKLFRHFSQADDSTTRRFGGTGLGLIISRNFARALGGDVVLERSEAGKGSAFLVTVSTGLPVAQAAAPSASRGAPALGAVPLRGVRVLLAEDAKDNQLLISRILTDDGAVVEVAEDGVEAVAKARSADFDVILMDIQMPRLSGYEATSQLRSLGYPQPIIALTAHALTEERLKTRAAGFDDHLTKPIDRAKLVDAIIHHAGKN